MRSPTAGEEPCTATSWRYLHPGGIEKQTGLAPEHPAPAAPVFSRAFETDGLQRSLATSAIL